MQRNGSLPVSAFAKLPALVAQEMERAGGIMWPQSERISPNRPLLPSVREFIGRSLESAVSTLGRDCGVPCVLEGMGLSISLLLSSTYSLRAPLICRPAPPWNIVPSSVGGPGSVDGPFSQQSQVDFGALKCAISSLPPLEYIACHWPTVIAYLDPSALLLLYYLIVLAPVRLVRAASEAAPCSAGGLSPIVSYDLIHGPPFSPQVFSAPPLLSSNVKQEVLPLWSARDAAEHGIVRAPLYHGTATENAHAIINFGLRSLSGTRHEASGAIFGEGVYLAGGVSVAKEFAVRRGMGWGGWSQLASDSKITRGLGPLSSPTPPSPSNKPLTPFRLVLEVQAIASPTNRCVVSGRNILLDKGSPPPKECYYIVTNPAHVHIKRVHVFSEESGTKVNSRIEGGGAAQGRSRCYAPWVHYIIVSGLCLYVAFRFGLLSAVGGGLVEEVEVEF